MTLRIVHGFPEAQRQRVARLFWGAFAGKLGMTLGPEGKALAFLSAAVRPDFAISALDDAGQVLGVSGFKTAEGGFIAADHAAFRRVYGPMGAIWRGLLLSVMERDVQAGQLLMDGIFVDRAARGLGIGTALIDAIIGEARARGLGEVRLDVIDGNPRARALYERLGFQAAGEERTGPLRLVFGFSRSTKMIRAVDVDA